MKNFNPFREFIFDYITVVAENTLAIAVIGSIFAQDAVISYLYFFMPFVLGIICMVPCIPIYLKEDMTIKQVLFQRGAELLVLEVALNYAVHILVGDSMNQGGYIAMIFAIAFLDVLSYLLKWFLEKEQADKVNKKIAEYRAAKEKHKE